MSMYIFLLWDGLGFFGFDPTKIDRLKGKNARWYDRFFNGKYMALQILFTGIIVVFLIKEYGHIGDVKSQQINTEYNDEYTFPAQDQLKITSLVNLDP